MSARDRIARQLVRMAPATYATEHTPAEEALYQAWVAKHNVPTKGDDYDMRGYYRALLAGDPRAQSNIDPNDQRMHYPDYWKTPTHETFSNESQWATPRAPQWIGDQLVSQGGQVLFDDARQGFLP